MKALERNNKYCTLLKNIQNQTISGIENEKNQQTHVLGTWNLLKGINEKELALVFSFFIYLFNRNTWIIEKFVFAHT